MVFSSDKRVSENAKLNIQPASEYGDGAYLFLQHCCIFMFSFCISAGYRSRFFFVKLVAGMVKEMFGDEKVGSTVQKRWDARPCNKYDVPRRT